MLAELTFRVHACQDDETRTSHANSPSVMTVRLAPEDSITYHIGSAHLAELNLCPVLQSPTTFAHPVESIGNLTKLGHPLEIRIVLA